MLVVLALVHVCTENSPRLLLKLWSACSISSLKGLASVVSWNWFSSLGGRRGDTMYMDPPAPFSFVILYHFTQCGQPPWAHQWNWLNQPSSFIQAVIRTPEFIASIVPEAQGISMYKWLLTPAKASSVLTAPARLNARSVQQSQSCRGTHQRVS